MKASNTYFLDHDLRNTNNLMHLVYLLGFRAYSSLIMQYLLDFVVKGFNQMYNVLSMEMLRLL